MRTIAEHGEVMLQKLRVPDLALDGDALAEAAHALAGSAGMFGFERLSTIGRRFEHAVQTEAADAPALARRLSAALEDALVEVRNRLPALA